MANTLYTRILHMTFSGKVEQMGIRKSAAEAVSAVSTAALQHVFRRPAGNFPGKMALYIDPSIIEHAAEKLQQGSICVVGTNGKTTVTNMLADCLTAAGQRVVCNRTGANLDSGVASSLLHAKNSDWGVFECDELWLVKILPYLQSRYVLLLNLFHDQVDRIGEIGYIQQSIIEALNASPHTTVIYNADDPFCEAIVRSVSNEAVAFGIDEALSFAHASEGNACMCQQCESMLNYAYRSYSQLGSYECPTCGFGRSNLRFKLRNCAIEENGMSFDVLAATDQQAVAGGTVAHINAPYTGTYMLYNLLAVYTAGHLVGLSNNVIQLTIKAYNPHNGRLEGMDLHGRKVLLNLAKNPTGFNQNVSLVLQETGPVAVGFFVNDKEGDGRDVSWLWDVNFDQLANRPDTVVFVGGMRANDLQVRLKYAGVQAVLVDGATQMLQYVASLPENYQTYIIANYTSLPVARAECVKIAEEEHAPQALPLPKHSGLPQPPLAGQALHIVQLYPDMLDQGGDGGNIAVLEKRCTWRGIPTEVQRIHYGEAPDFAQADIVVLGDGFDRQQRLACQQLLPYKDQLSQYVEKGGVLLAIDGGLQLLGASWNNGAEELEGLGLLDIHNSREENSERHVGDIVVDTLFAAEPVVGFENHAGITKLGSGQKVFGKVLHGVGNNAEDSTEGIRYHNLIGTYVHGPVLAKNPALADWLIEQALRQKGIKEGLAQLDNTEELAANAFILSRLKLS